MLWSAAQICHAQGSIFVRELQSKSENLVQKLPPNILNEHGKDFESLFSKRDLTPLILGLDTSGADMVFVQEEYFPETQTYSLAHRYFFLQDSIFEDDCGNFKTISPKARYVIRGDTAEKDYYVSASLGKGSARISRWQLGYIGEKGRVKTRIHYVKHYLTAGSEIPNLEGAGHVFEGNFYGGSKVYFTYYWGGCTDDFREKAITRAREKSLEKIPSVRVRSLINLRDGTVLQKLEYPLAHHPERISIYYGRRFCN